ncbi:MAG: hypothetical protein KDE50_00655 [Caldilineaceae bacterium]|nr:hypothetical protein [Caldilineaceae bacterium]
MNSDGSDRRYGDYAYESDTQNLYDGKKERIMQEKTESKSLKTAEFSQDLALYAGLFGFGLMYNRIVGELNQKYGQHGYTSILVAFGVSVTLAILSLRVGAENTLRLATGFAFSGLPMIFGDTSRYLRYKQEVSEILAKAHKARKGFDNARQSAAGEGQGSEAYSHGD